MDPVRMKPTHKFQALVGQLWRFGVVGGLATVVHLATFSVMSEWMGSNPLIANCIGFALAFCVTLVGQGGWTFKSQGGASWKTPRTAARLLFSSLIGLGLNSLIVLLVVVELGYSSFAALPFMATLVPALLFVLNKYWVFGAVEAGRSV